MTIHARIAAGQVQYNAEDAEIPIDEFIKALEDAKADGATHVLGLSGNWRGGQFVSLGMPIVIDDDEEEW